MDIADAQDLILAFQRLFRDQRFTQLDIDFSAVRQFDSAGAATLFELDKAASAQGARLTYSGMSKEISGLLGLVHADLIKQSYEARPEKQPGAVVRLGGATMQILDDAAFLVRFIGEIFIGLYHACLQPKKVRWGDIIVTMLKSGVDAIPIVVLINFLIGLIMGFQAAIQLRQFGANIFVADLVGLAQVRELGPLMTAIIVAGRSGSAFAAEIGTMKVSEEVDAITAMGMDTTRFLIVPKMLALLLTLPTLTLLADAVGIVGGLIVGVGVLDLTVTQYVNQTTKAMGLFDVFSGYFKSYVFAFLVAGIGCMRGFQVRGGAQGVGAATTSSVVTGIFLIILADAVFTILFNYL